MSVADQHQFTGTGAFPGKTYSPARSSGANIGRVLGIAHEREVAAEEMARAISVQAVAFSLREAVTAISSMLSMERAAAYVT